MSKAGEDNLGSSSHAPQGGSSIAAQFPSVADDEISELVLFEVRPQVFDGIEFRRVSRQRCKLQPPLGGGHELLDQPTAMDGSSIPKNQQWRVQVPQKCGQELDDLRALDGARMDLEIEIPQRHSRDDRKTLPAKSLLDHRSLAARRPSPHPVRARAQAAFVDEDNGASLPLGFFLRFGQV